MKKGMNFSVVVIGLLVVAIVAMSIGFASFAQNLNITGNTTVQSTSWNVQFKTDSYSETAGSMTVDTGNRVINATSMTYNVTLSKPGEFYEFTIDVENTGTFDAQLEGITMSSLTTEQQKYLVYKINEVEKRTKLLINHKNKIVASDKFNVSEGIMIILSILAAILVVRGFIVVPGYLFECFVPASFFAFVAKSLLSICKDKEIGIIEFLFGICFGGLFALLTLLALLGVNLWRFI